MRADFISVKHASGECNKRKTIGQFLMTGHNIPMQQIAEVFVVEHCPIADSSHF